MMVQGSAEQRQAFPQPPIERGEAGQVVPGAYEAKLGHLRRGRGASMDTLSLQNPLFATYVIAAAAMILKAASMSWLTVVRMLQVKGGWRSPEDLRKG
jgi:hypothetical protein